MNNICTEYLRYITEGINISDKEFNKRIEDISLKDDISNEEYCEIYRQAMDAYKLCCDLY